LFRQPKFGDWDSAVAALRQALLRIEAAPQHGAADLPRKLSA
jgi:hypothetical protein